VFTELYESLPQPVEKVGLIPPPIAFSFSAILVCIAESFDQRWQKAGPKDRQKPSVKSSVRGLKQVKPNSERLY
jgi:hypothetical protein